MNAAGQQACAGAFLKVLEEVQHTEKTNTRNAGTDWRCRQFFVEHGDTAAALLRAVQENRA